MQLRAICSSLAGLGALTLAGMQLLALAGAYTLGFQSGQQGAKRAVAQCSSLPFRSSGALGPVRGTGLRRCWAGGGACRDFPHPFALLRSAVPLP